MLESWTGRSLVNSDCSPLKFEFVGLTHLQRFWWSLSCRSMKLLYRASLKVTPRSTAHTTYGLICLVCPSTSLHQTLARRRAVTTITPSSSWMISWLNYLNTSKSTICTDKHPHECRVDNTPQVSQPFFALILSGYPQRENLELDLFQWRPAAPLPNPPDITSRNWKGNIACQSSTHLCHTLL